MKSATFAKQDSGRAWQINKRGALTQSLGVLAEPPCHVHVLRHVGELLALREQLVGMREELRPVPRGRQQRARLKVAVQGGPMGLSTKI